MASENNSSQVVTFGTDIHSTDFDPNFVWGTATSSYQIEGAALEGGRGYSIWDVFCLRYPERITGGTNGNEGTKSYYKIKEDVQIMKKMGMKAYRFSVSWSRILPGGKLSLGINKEGVDFYNELINELIANGIEPFITLWHWDTPNSLEEEYMGFLSENIVVDFIQYAEFCFWEFGDRVKNWITLNEPWSYAAGGYVWGSFAPGRGATQPEHDHLLGSGLNFGQATRICGLETYHNSAGNPGTEPYIVAHNLILCHAAVVKLYREKFQGKQLGKIGVTLVSQWFVPLDSNSQEDRKSVVTALDFVLGWFLQPLITGDYPAIMRTNVGDRLPEFTKEQVKLVKGSYDFIGLNYYTSKYVTRAEPTTVISYLNDSHVHEQAEGLDGKLIGPQGGAVWFNVYPDGLYQLLMYIKATYGDFEIYITENGYVEKTRDDITLEKARVDVERVEYYNAHLHKLKDAITDGVNVKGYFAWSLMDNFEWGDGYSVRFGLMYVDFRNGLLSRYPKHSALWFLDFLRYKEVAQTKAGTKRVITNGVQEVHDSAKKLKKWAVQEVHDLAKKSKIGAP